MVEFIASVGRYVGPRSHECDNKQAIIFHYKLLIMLLKFARNTYPGPKMIGCMSNKWQFPHTNVLIVFIENASIRKRS